MKVPELGWTREGRNTQVCNGLLITLVDCNDPNSTTLLSPVLDTHCQTTVAVGRSQNKGKGTATSPSTSKGAAMAISIEAIMGLQIWGQYSFQYSWQTLISSASRHAPEVDMYIYAFSWGNKVEVQTKTLSIWALAKYAKGCSTNAHTSHKLMNYVAKIPSSASVSTLGSSNLTARQQRFHQIHSALPANNDRKAMDETMDLLLYQSRSTKMLAETINSFHVWQKKVIIQITDMDLKSSGASFQLRELPHFQSGFFF